MTTVKEEEKVTGLPENAYRELKEGETYRPLMSADKTYKEIIPWSVLWGLVMGVVFSAAAAYLGLKVGQVFEAAIPIAIIAVGLSKGFKRKNAIGENVIIRSIGACSRVIVAGAIFTLPALYILQDKYPEITIRSFEVFMSSLLGGILGILLWIPFRKYFVSDMHGKYPFPEATATTQVLVSGERGGNQAKPLIFAGLIGGAVNWHVGSRSKEETLNRIRFEKGTLIASGFIAGGALMGVVSAVLRFAGINMVNETWQAGKPAGILAFGMYILLIVYLAAGSLKISKEKNKP